MNDAALPQDDLSVPAPVARPYQGRMRPADVRDDFDPFPDVPSDLAPSLRLVHVLLVLRQFVRVTVLTQHVRFDDLAVVFQEAERAGQSGAGCS